MCMYICAHVHIYTNTYTYIGLCYLSMPSAGTMLAAKSHIFSSKYVLLSFYIPHHFLWSGWHNLKLRLRSYKILQHFKWYMWNDKYQSEITIADKLIHQLNFLPATSKYINTLRQNGCQLPGNIFECIFLNDKISVLIKISLKFAPKGLISNIPALVQIMAWCRPGNTYLN